MHKRENPEDKEMDLDQLRTWLAYMTMINTCFFAIGLMKITVFAPFTRKITQLLFGAHADDIEIAIPKILLTYWILIIMFNLTPYLALRLF